MTTPLVSVILPTYNGSRYIKETLESVINQSYKNLEIIVVDDSSTDNTVEIIKSYHDERISLYQNDKNLGIAENTNRALSLAKGEYIMMQDHDDISMPKRAEMMVMFLMDNKSITGIGSSTYQISESTNGDAFAESRPPIVALSADKLKCTELFDTLLFHPTIMYRRSVLDNVDTFYSKDFKVCADIDFFDRLNSSKDTSWVVLENKYLKYRRHKQSLSNELSKLLYDEKRKVFSSVIKRLINIATEEEISLHSKAVCRKEVLSYNGSINHTCISWYRKIIKFNLDNKAFNHELLLAVMADNWKYFSALSNIFTPFRGIKMYNEIDELKPYLKSNINFLKEWQKRFFRALSWKILGNKSLK